MSEQLIHLLLFLGVAGGAAPVQRQQIENADRAPPSVRVAKEAKEAKEAARLRSPCLAAPRDRESRAPCASAVPVRSSLRAEP